MAVFLDYQNVFGIARQCFGRRPADRTDGQVDPLALGRLIVSRRPHPSALSEVRVYRGLPDRTRDPRTHGAAQRQMAAWSRSPLVRVVARPLRYPRRWPAEPAQEKGVDVALGIDFVRLAVQGAYDVGVLMSTDTDLVPALEAVLELTGVRVEVAAWRAKRANPRLSVGHDKPWCHHLGRADYDAVHDPTDYAPAAPAAPDRA
ncbi:MAG TPA: NYN domain-containing protein [Mycobacteriales bacterium]